MSKYQALRQAPRSHRASVVYGTGWYYPSYWSPYHYYPYHSTWGFHVRWNPWYGWSCGLSFASGPFRLSIGWGGYGGFYGGGFWGPMPSPTRVTVTVRAIGRGTGTAITMAVTMAVSMVVNDHRITAIPDRTAIFMGGRPTVTGWQRPRTAIPVSSRRLRTAEPTTSTPTEVAMSTGAMITAVGTSATKVGGRRTTAFLQRATEPGPRPVARPNRQLGLQSRRSRSRMAVVHRRGRSTGISTLASEVASARTVFGVAATRPGVAPWEA